MQLTILIPAHNEAERIRPMLEDYARATENEDTELLVIVNGSRDATEQIVRTDFLPRYPHIRLIVLPAPVGKGGALMRGMLESRGARVGYTDADGAVPAEAFLALAGRLCGDELVIGSRWLPDSDIPRKQPLPRLISSRFFNGLVRILFRFPYTDTQCGAKILSRKVADTVRPRLGATQWAFDVDLILQTRRAGFPVREFPTTWRDVDGTKVRYFRTSMEMFLAVSRLRMLHSPLRGLVVIWDRTLGVRLFEKRLARMREIYPPQTEP